MVPASGWAISDTQPTPDGVGRIQAFQTGYICKPPHDSVRTVAGVLAQKWGAMGLTSGVLGYPVEGQTTQDDGGTLQWFVNGAICASHVGLHEVHGSIGWKWRHLPPGWQDIDQSQPGWPLTDELVAPDGTRYSRFERGVLSWRPGSGPFAAYVGEPPAAGPPPPRPSTDPDLSLAPIAPTNWSLVLTPVFPKADEDFTVTWADV